MTNDAGLVVRGVASSDEAAWKLLWAEYLAFYEATIDRAVTDVTWQRVLDAGEPVRGIVATLADRPVGLAHVVLQRSTWSIEPTAYLQDLFVATTHRRAGVAHALIQAARTCAASVAAKRLVWLTRHDNLPARALYDRIGAATGFVQYAALTTPRVNGAPI